VSGADSGDAGQNNPITVTFHRKPSSSNCTFPGDESLIVEVWVANPSLAISPKIHESAARVELTGAALPLEGTSGTQQIDWSPLRASHTNDPQNPGQKCLVARAYPSSGVANVASFFVPGDHHVAQRNLCVVTSPTTNLTFSVNTFGPGKPQTVIKPLPNARLRAVMDIHPSQFVRNTVSSRLPHQGLRLHTAPLEFGFKFDLTNLHASDVVDHSHPTTFPSFPPNTNPFFEARVALETQHVTPVTFLANLKGLPAGEVCIFHLIQASFTDDGQGGLTLVVLKT